METVCAICGGQLQTEYMEIRGHGLRERRPVGVSCPTGCTETPDYAAARDAVARGEKWVPKEPSHCNVAMLKSDPGIVINDVRQVRYTCPICREHEYRGGA